MKPSRNRRRQTGRELLPRVTELLWVRGLLEISLACSSEIPFSRGYLSAMQLLENFPAFYGTVFTRALNRPLF
jgi:hypothetical protein